MEPPQESCSSQEPYSRLPFDAAASRGEIIVAEPLWRRYVSAPERLVARALIAAGCAPSVVLTNDATVKRLNARDRGRNKPTNVLTYEAPPEIIVALGTVLREARAAGRRPAHHLAHLIVHGALHLAGEDHHHAGDARRMERLEARLLARLGVPNPWKHQS
ncbi:rRNA maturation RNase YbeY [Acidiphilium iwatense]|uniref:Endoribonuclease YbeY n=1 Tax=Acidiphilium iwatense TaxID=768198 RepID=A0ABS9DTE3_9PROT|nr:rRNA maturation RNase YbeY [Acidiphilium iwatense]MCF3945954.1 rRNA maturation RNase YbeY [Acidiphilium iwatense]